MSGTWPLGICSGDTGLKCECLMKEMAGGVGSALVGLHLKSIRFRVSSLLTLGIG